MISEEAAAAVAAEVVVFSPFYFLVDATVAPRERERKTVTSAARKVKLEMLLML